MVFLSTFQSHDWHRRTNVVGECQTPRSIDYLRPLQSQASGWIFRRSSRINRVFQWLVSLSPITSLFVVATKMFLVSYREHPEAAKNVLATSIIQRLKALIYKDFMSKLLSCRARFHPTDKSGGLSLSRSVTIAVMTDGSPSCGSTYVDAGRFDGSSRSGRGVVVQMLCDAGVRVFPETNLEAADAYLRELEQQGQVA